MCCYIVNPSSENFNNMPYAKSRKISRRVRRRPAMRRYQKGRRLNYGKVKSLIIKTVNKGREKKRLFAQIDEQQIDPYLSSTIMTFSSLSTTLANSYCPLALVKGNNAEQRIGNTVQPVSFSFDGLLKFTGGTENQPFRTVITRVAFGFCNQDYDQDPSNLITSDIMLKSGTTSALQGDFNDLFLPFNWKKFRPVFDKKYYLTPSAYNNQTDHVYTNGTGKDWARVRMRYSFGKNAKQQRYVSNASAIPMDRALVCIIISRVMTDDTVAGLISIEVTGTSCFTFTDA